VSAKQSGPWCRCGHHVTDHNGNYNGSAACDHCPCPRYALAKVGQRQGRWDDFPAGGTETAGDTK
jgi:hypothetical protein